MIGPAVCFARRSSSSISNEGVSLLENAGHLGLPIPWLKAVLEQLHDRSEKEDK